MNARRAAFSLPELCVVIGIFSVLLLLVISGVGAVRERGKEAHCVGNLRQVGTALLMYVNDHGGRFPLSGETISGNIARIWAGTLYHDGYLPDIDTFYCPSHPEEYRPERRLLKNGPLNAWANISYGASKFGLMPNSSMLSTHRPARLSAIQEPGQTLMLAEARVIAQTPGGWYQFWPDFVAASRPTNEETIVYGRHGGRASLMYCDGRVEVAHVRNDLYRRTSQARNAPWFSSVYSRVE